MLAAIPCLWRCPMQLPKLSHSSTADSSGVAGTNPSDDPIVVPDHLGGMSDIATILAARYPAMAAMSMPSAAADAMPKRSPSSATDAMR